MFYRLPSAFGFRGLVSGEIVTGYERCSAVGGKRSGCEHGNLLLIVYILVVNQLLIHYQKEG